VLLAAAREFIQAASACPGVRRIALVGSLTTDKPVPKDADVLVTIDGGMELGPSPVPAGASRTRRNRSTSAPTFFSPTKLATISAASAAIANATLAFFVMHAIAASASISTTTWTT
jgi:hypothetical protein